jgi:hypothetical protein
VAVKHAELRPVLDEYGYGINDAANGRWLPKEFHQCMHTDLMYNNVVDEVRQYRIDNPPNIGSGSKEAFADFLQEVGRKLESGEIKIR